MEWAILWDRLIWLDLHLSHHPLQVNQLTYVHTQAARYPPKEDDLEYVFEVCMPFPIYSYETHIFRLCLYCVSDYTQTPPRVLQLPDARSKETEVFCTK